MSKHRASLSTCREALRRVGVLSWKILRVILAGGAVMGPSAPPPPPPPPQTIELRADEETGEDEA